jgi:hypothetical protein
MQLRKQIAQRVFGSLDRGIGPEQGGQGFPPHRLLGQRHIKERGQRLLWQGSGQRLTIQTHFWLPKETKFE